MIYSNIDLCKPVLMAGIQNVYWEFPEKSMATSSMTYKQILHSTVPWLLFHDSGSITVILYSPVWFSDSVIIIYGINNFSIIYETISTKTYGISQFGAGNK